MCLSLRIELWQNVCMDGEREKEPHRFACSPTISHIQIESERFTYFIQIFRKHNRTFIKKTRKSKNEKKEAHTYLSRSQSEVN